MSLQTRLTDLAAAVGADVKTLQNSSWKTAVRFASNLNVNIAAPGANIDGIAANVGDRVLLPSQTLPSEKGIYIYNGAAVPMTRAPDAATATKMPMGTRVMVTDGSNNKWTVWEFLSGGFSNQTWSNNFYFGNNSRIQGNSSQIIVVANGVSYNFDSTGLDLASKSLTSVLDPVNAQDAATKHYVDTRQAIGWETRSAGTGQNPGANVWALCPIGAVTNQSGDPAALTRNANGTMTVRDAGMYAISTRIGFGLASSGSRRLVRLVIGTDANANVLSLDERQTESNGYPEASVSFVGFLAAGTNMSVQGFSDATVAFSCNAFGIGMLR